MLPKIAILYIGDVLNFIIACMFIDSHQNSSQKLVSKIDVANLLNNSWTLFTKKTPYSLKRSVYTI